MSPPDKSALREGTYLEIGSSAAVPAGLAVDTTEARRNMEEIILKHADKLKRRWFYERGGGAKGWKYFLRTFGFEEVLIVRRKDSGGG